ncbi:MAG: chemotaxis response regulator protein-glutamate methylesterase [Planctomycetaceae bacterium]
MKKSPVRVLVVDDSAVIRGLLSKALETDPEIEVVGTAMHGDLALTWLRKNTADVVILDVEMPVMDGLTALQRIQEEHPYIKVVMASGLTYQGAETTIKALAMGAAGCIAKPNAASASESVEQVVRELVPLVKALKGNPSQSGPVSRRSGTVRTPGERSAGAPLAIVIGSSTGGPRALSQVLTSLPQDFSVPIFIVQHMPPMFTPMLAKHLQQDTGRPCQEAVNGGPVERGRTYVAPGDFHMEIDKQDNRMVTRLTQHPPEHFCRPSVNPLFRTAAAWYGKNLLGVMLTGMGEDGIEGTRDLVQKGGYMLSQDEATSVVWGMPAAVCRENLAHEILPVTSIGSRILEICGGKVAYA